MIKINNGINDIYISTDDNFSGETLQVEIKSEMLLSSINFDIIPTWNERFYTFQIDQSLLKMVKGQHQINILRNNDTIHTDILFVVFDVLEDKKYTNERKIRSYNGK